MDESLLADKPWRGRAQVTILARRLDDELLLLASDGLWDVLSNQEACTLAKRCLRRARQRGASRQSAARIAATVCRGFQCRSGFQGWTSGWVFRHHCTGTVCCVARPGTEQLLEQALPLVLWGCARIAAIAGSVFHHSDQDLQLGCEFRSWLPSWQGLASACQCRRTHL